MILKRNLLLVNCFYILCFFILNISSTLSQNAIVGTGFSSGWGGSGCPTANSNFNYFSNGFGSSFGAVLSPNNVGNCYFRFGIDWSGTTAQRTITLGSDVPIVPATTYSLNNNCTTSGSMVINVPNINYKYAFKTQNAGTNPSGNFIVFEVQGIIQSVTSVSQNPITTAVTPSSPVNITASLSGSLPAGQGVYLRYTIDNFSTSTILEMTGSGSSFSGTIPAQALGTLVKYYIFTSGSNLSISHNNADWYTINGNTNGGSNYSYTVISAPMVTVSPTSPTDNLPVTITFNATGTALAGLAKVYLHSGVATNVTSPTSFNYTTGNWGQDDGIGLMTNTVGNIWTITLLNLRSYYNVPK
ncbi:MAG: hypothetical protein IPO92_08325 [Saprospiraceae bacterium]|nr:hypothetical protein [Saprospiraceae bacterium]